jgi:pimeloyl-ACP methyl ester carboxylesterase
MHDFDWRQQERLINRLPQFVARIEGLDIHYVHQPGKGPAPFPLIVSHGWPSSFFEAYKIIGRLADPGSFGGDPADAFDVVVPSLPGFGFSERPGQPGFIAVDRFWRALMTDHLGYRKFGAHGTDIGARVTSALGRFHPDAVVGIHLGSVYLEWPDPLPKTTDLTPAELDYVERVRRWEREEGAYGEIQATRPQTLAYGLNDSPAGLAAWIVEKFRAWSDCGGDVETRFSKDELLTNVMIYWVTQTIASSCRLYCENRRGGRYGFDQVVKVPTGVAVFPKEIYRAPRRFAEPRFNLVHWSVQPRGGHFAALEQPELFVEDVRAFFRKVRQAP